MKKMLLVLCFIAVASLTFAQSTSVMGRKNAAFPISFGSHTLKGAYVVENELDAGMIAGYNNIDTISKVVCPGTSGNCLFMADQWIQDGAVSYNSEQAMCFLIDGNLVDGCYFAGETAADGTWRQFSTSHGATVQFGKHTVLTQFFSGAGGDVVSFYNITYRVYKP